MTKAGSSLLRVTLVQAADHARKQDPQLAKIYYTQMVARDQGQALACPRPPAQGRQRHPRAPFVKPQLVDLH